MKELARLETLSARMSERSSDFIDFGYSWKQRLKVILEELEEPDTRIKTLHMIIEQKDREISRLLAEIERLSA